jgi:hypothetical protein
MIDTGLNSKWVKNKEGYNQEAGWVGWVGENG